MSVQLKNFWVKKEHKKLIIGTLESNFNDHNRLSVHKTSSFKTREKYLDFQKWKLWDNLDLYIYFSFGCMFYYE